MSKPENTCPILFENVFSKSAEVAISAQKIKTAIPQFNIVDKDHTPIEGTTVYVGTAVTLHAVLQYQKPDGNYDFLTTKRVKFYHKLGTGSWELLGDAGANCPPSNPKFYDLNYTLNNAGVHTFYAEFEGDAIYEGCTKEVKAFAKMRSR